MVNRDVCLLVEAKFGADIGALLRGILAGRERTVSFGVLTVG
jgi:hypothetical protein